MNLLNIEVPIISAINGPAWHHSEIPLLCDIVLAADTAQFQDSAHFNSDVVPGDGMHIAGPYRRSERRFPASNRVFSLLSGRRRAAFGNFAACRGGSRCG